MIFKDGPLENLDRFLKIALPFICLNDKFVGSLERYFQEQNSKNKKTQQQQFLSIEKNCCCWFFLFFEFCSINNLSNAPKQKFLQ
jgi:hypothetical protein